MSPPRPIRIEKLPAGRWQVIWYGDLAYDPSSGNYSQPTIALVLHCPDGRTDARPRVRVPFSLIAVVPIGSIWVDGERVDECPAGAALLRKIDVDPNRVVNTKAGAPSDTGVGKFLIPFELFNGHRHDTTSTCLRWTTTAGEIILLPAIEAIRFYFGTSSFLLKRIISGQRPLEAMWTEATLDPHSRMARLHLAPDVPQQKSPREIARIALDRNARRAADLVLRSARIAAGYRSPIYPRMAFPFWQSSTLSVAGVPVDDGNGPARFVIVRIDSCTGPYPYTHLVVSGGRDLEDATPGDSSLVDNAGSKGHTAMSIGSGEPSDTRVARSEGRWEGHRFTDLIRKKVDFVASPPPAQSAGRGGSLANDGAFGLGDGAHDGSGAPLELSVETLPAGIAFVDARLISENDPAGQWDHLSRELLEDDAPVRVVLMTSSELPWAIGLAEESRCMVSKVPANSLDYASMVIETINAWLHVLAIEAADWFVFAPEQVNAGKPRWRTVGVGLELTSFVRMTFKESDAEKNARLFPSLPATP